jgi:hydrogenase/urease accessory protein HupE
VKRGFTLAAIVAVVALPAFAHQLWPAYLQLTERADGVYDVLFKLPKSGGVAHPLTARLPEQCESVGVPRAEENARALVHLWSVRCPGGLDGKSLTVDGLAIVSTEALVRIERAGGSSQVSLLTPDEPVLTLQPRLHWLDVARGYFVLGVEHILLGIDHLLFVLALLIITKGLWALVKTVTAFTIAHSITLALATLGIVNLPSAPIEAIIALSIVFVAAEIVHARQGRPGIAARAPWIVAFVFGLLHGFGFAGALSEVGLPPDHVPLALLFFNLGVEAGQLVFVAAMLVLVAVWRRTRIALPQWAELVTPYAIGSIAMVWVIDRVGSVFTG